MIRVILTTCAVAIAALTAIASTPDNAALQGPNTSILRDDAAAFVDQGIVHRWYPVMGDFILTSIDKRAQVFDGGKTIFNAGTAPIDVMLGDLLVSLNAGSMITIARGEGGGAKSCSTSCGVGTYSCCFTTLNNTVVCECRDNTCISADCESGGSGSTACSISVN